MKVYNENNSSWGSKINFVDENNVYLGYDLSQSCCEHADWFIADKPCQDVQEQADQNPDLTGFVFDTIYFKDASEDFHDQGGMVVFRITNGTQEKFIHLYNCHNGYYSHGFEFKAGDSSIRYSSI